MATLFTSSSTLPPPPARRNRYIPILSTFKNLPLPLSKSMYISLDFCITSKYKKRQIQRKRNTGLLLRSKLMYYSRIIEKYLQYLFFEYSHRCLPLPPPHHRYQFPLFLGEHHLLWHKLCWCLETPSRSSTPVSVARGYRGTWAVVILPSH